MTTQHQPATLPTYYPVFLDLRGKRCLVVGGGAVARRKVEGLQEAGAEVTVVAPRVLPMAEGVHVQVRRFLPADLDGMVFVIAATDDAEVNALVAREATARGIWVNVADAPALCTVILPALVRRGALRIAISTGGASPSLARRLRERFEREFCEEYGELVALLWRLRQTWEPRAIAAQMPPALRHHTWERVLDLPLLDALRAGDASDAERAAAEILETALAEYEAG